MISHNQWLFEAPSSPEAVQENTALEWSEAEATRRSQETDARLIRQAILKGERDETRLTDQVFFARYPALRGQKLKPSDPLRQDWLRIRDRLVRPALRRVSSAPPSSRPASQPAWVQKLLPLLKRYQGNIPLPFLLGWIAVESDGRIDKPTELDERGYFQIHPDESKKLRLAHQRLSAEPDYSIKSGIQLVQYYANIAQKRYKLAFGTDLFWHIVKLLHWLPGGVPVILKDMRERGIEPTTWEELKQYVIANRERIRQRIKTEYKRSWDPMRGIVNVDKVFERGRKLAATLENR